MSSTLKKCTPVAISVVLLYEHCELLGVQISENLSLTRSALVITLDQEVCIVVSVHFPAALPIPIILFRSSSSGYCLFFFWLLGT